MRFILYVYVVDENKKLVGVVSMRKLLLVDKDKTMAEIYKPLPNISTLKVDDKLDDIVELMTKYNLLTAAVLNDRGEMKGLVSIDDVMRELKPNA
jgi:magnesium transporter